MMQRFYCVSLRQPRHFTVVRVSGLLRLFSTHFPENTISISKIDVAKETESPVGSHALPPEVREKNNRERSESTKQNFRNDLGEDIYVSSQQKVKLSDSVNAGNLTAERNGFGHRTLCERIEKLGKGHGIEAAFQSWMREGLPVHRGDIFHSINRLRRVKKYRLALQVAEWVVREKPYKLEAIEFSYLIEFTAKVMGIEKAEKLLGHVPQEFQNELLYNNIVMACMEKRLIGKTLFYMRKMRYLLLRISPIVYNRLILFYESLSRKTYIPNLLIQMKADGVAPNVATYNILLNIKAKDHDIQGLKAVFAKMKQVNVQPDEMTYCILAKSFATARLFDEAKLFAELAEKTRTNGTLATLEILLSVYGSLLKEEEVKQTWKHVSDIPYIRSRTYIQAVEAFGKVGNIGQAEEIWSKMISRNVLKLTEHYNAIFSVYGKHGLIDKASKCFREMQAENCKPNAITYHHLILCCLKANMVDEALETAKMIKDVRISRKTRLSIPWLETSLLIVQAFADKGNVNCAKYFFKHIKMSKYRKHAFVYNTLLTAYVNANLYPKNFIKQMILSGAKPDAETYDLLQLQEGRL